MRSTGSSGTGSTTPKRPPLLAAALVFAALAGCTTEPSYQLQWRLDDDLGDDLVVELTAISQCAQTGITKLEVTTSTLAGDIVDVSRYPCFPAEFADGEPTDGPVELLPGDYTLDIVGLRRTDEPWLCEADAEPCVAVANASVTIAEGSLPVVDFVLLRPPECDDGVDNDGDGRVDAKDPACIADPAASEGDDANATVIDIRTSFLDSEAVYLEDVNLSFLSVSLDGQLLAQVNSASLDKLGVDFVLPLLTAQLEAGEHTLEFQGLGGPQPLSSDPLTEVLSYTFDPSTEPYVSVDFDLTADRFLAPILEPVDFFATLVPYPGADLSQVLACALSDGTPVETVRMRVRDEADQFLDAATLGLNVSAEDLAQGWVSFPCAGGDIRSADLTWANNFSVELEAYVGDTVCFADAQERSVGPTDGVAPLAPQGKGGAQIFDLQRVVDDEGLPPPGCEECVVDGDCLSDSFSCVNNLCVD